MPSASQSVEEAYVRHWGSYDENACWDYLESKGCRCNRGGIWRVPAAAWKIDKVAASIRYLAEEWDYGWVIV